MFLPRNVYHKEAASDAVTASRERTAIEAAHDLAMAHDKARQARATVIDVAARLAEAEAQLAGLAVPNDDMASVRAWRETKENLADMITLRRQKLTAAEENVRACDADVETKTAALRKALAELDAPVLDSLADLPKLKPAAEKARSNANKTAVAYEQAQTAGAGALAAFDALPDRGADKEIAARILQDRKQARANIAAARQESLDSKSEAASLESRVAALESLADRERRFGILQAGVSKLEAQLPALGAVAKRYEEIAADLAGLYLTCSSYVRSYLNTCSRLGGYNESDGQILMLAPAFKGSLTVPALSWDGFFLIDNYTHNYGQFDVRQDILTALIETLNGPRPDIRHSRTMAAELFAKEYDRLTANLVECAAVFAMWLIERNALFADAGDAAEGVAQPVYPLLFRVYENRFWQRLSLPSFYKKGEFVWNPTWAPPRLIELTRVVQAA